MGCLKCGRDTTDSHVFCQECLLDMHLHPVQPGTAVILPKNREIPVQKKLPKRRILTQEEQIHTLRVRIRVLSVFLAIFILLSGLLAAASWQHFVGSRFKKGQNYSVATTPAAAPLVIEPTQNSDSVTVPVN